MQKEHQPYNIQPADRLANVSEYYFSRKLKEVAQMNAEGKNVISLGIGSPDMLLRKKPSMCCANRQSVLMRTDTNLLSAFLNYAKPWPTGTSVGIM